ncbi:acyl-CoA thioesterase [Actinoalloteichus hymeniacidonis]|uniref:Thioesterase n=1 Tax=Actinoalloteichus hymeniacidonis TaxID=340345 RepID=A0AAC9HN19_9PSEU|nr:thioesterase family protein [Actinoalloteichus hymeniacidonis]AOS61835.1 putative thioesterase [Actinoalloteichus hymeniacidonis]MBB5910145.1 acyl-CoA thioester hydrolase [Actinoalloteichus hymeniacidonis]
MTATPSANSDSRLLPVHRRVEHADTDASGVMHFARYPVLLETALLANLERLGAGLAVLARDGLDLVVTEVRTQYRSPARYPDELVLAPTVGHLGAARARIDTTIRRRNEDTELATGSLLIAVTDRATGAPCALHPALHAILEESRSDARR